MDQNTAKTKMPSKLNLHGLATICVIVLLLYENFFVPPKRLVSITDPVFTLSRPDSIKKIEDNYYIDNPLILFGLKNFSFILNSEACDLTNGPLLLIMVQSETMDFAKRQVIRQSWGKSDNVTRVIFLLAQTANKRNAEKIINESILYKDIAQGSVYDGYRNLTYKHVMGLKWVLNHCNNAKYILKADDDIVLNAVSLRNFLVRVLSPWGAENLLFCNYQNNMPVIRNKTKWKVTLEEFKDSTYPPYCSGFAILYSKDVIPRLLSHVNEVPYLFIDDVYVTGLLRNAANINITNMKDLYQNYRDVIHRSYKKSTIFGGYNFNSYYMQSVWKELIKM